MNLKTVNPRLRIMLFLSFGIGSALLLISRMFKEELPDLMLGFIEGISVVSILMGMSYMIWSVFAQCNPKT